MRYKAVILDIDDTLYDYAPLNDTAIESVVRLARDKYSIDSEEFKTAFSLARNETKRVLQDTGASHNRMLYFQKTIEKLGLKPAVIALDLYECYWGYMLDNMQFNEGVKECLQYCETNAIKIGICSDLTAHIQHRKLQKLGIADFIDAIVTSEEAGVEKPDQRTFSMILEKLEVKPEDALYIGDSFKKDVQGAKSAGIDVLWYNGKDGDSQTVHSFFEVLERLKV